MSNNKGSAGAGPQGTFLGKGSGKHEGLRVVTKCVLPGGQQSPERLELSED